MNYQLKYYPDPVLSKKCENVSLPLSAEDKALLDSMYDYVKNEENNAAGLAAPQFGVTKRMFAMRVKVDGNIFNVKLVNPIIIPVSKKTYMVPDGESCLSEPGTKVVVNRHKDIILLGYDAIYNKNIRARLSGFAAAVAQHELDHLNGKLLHDYEGGKK